jgi:hypothetical protein
MSFKVDYWIFESIEACNFIQIYVKCSKTFSAEYTQIPNFNA